MRKVSVLCLGLLILARTSSSQAEAGCDGNHAVELVSLQGGLLVDPNGGKQWRQGQLNEKICEGSWVEVQANSRASLLLPSGIVIRLDAGTVLKLNQVEPSQPTLVNLVNGFFHFISRTSKKLEITTPIANAGPEGTEFAIRVDHDKASLWVYEGAVKFFNDKGSIHLKPGEAGQTLVGQAPQTHIDVKPQDAVSWALYYPPVLPFPDKGVSINPDIRLAIDEFRRGQTHTALTRLAALSSDKQTPYYLKVRAAMLLTTGRIEPAQQTLKRLLEQHSRDAEALAMQSILKLTQNRKDEAYALAKQAILSNPQSAAAYSALSYAEQSRFDLDKALDAASNAVKLVPHDAMTWARKAELELSSGLSDASENSVQQALQLDANIERTQTVAGFAYLMNMETGNAQLAFEKAIQLDSTSPLAHLGLGLTKIRNGDLPEGRQYLEIAAILDPNNSLIRSYLGKAYYEEKRNPLAEDQFKLAKERDPKDPTPYFYDAIKKQTENRPIEALHDLQQAMELNDNRAVYRSKQLLDSDRAARGASLARIYDNLGFQQRGIVEATSSLQLDPTNFSAHRFLSDSYVNQPGRETAQLSELLQAKMLQPININPVQPHLSVSQRGLLSASGMANSSFQDFTRTFEGNRPQLLVSGIAGNQGVLGDEVTLSGIVDKFSYSLGQFHYQSDGFKRPNGRLEDRDNARQRHNIYDVFFQGALTERVNVQLEYINRETRQGNLRQIINANDDEDFSDNNFLRQNSYRFGTKIDLFSHSKLLFTYTRNDLFSHHFSQSLLEDNKIQLNSNIFDAQYLFYSDLFNIVAGSNVFDTSEKNAEHGKNSINGNREYIYVYGKPISVITATLGLTYDYLETNDYGASLKPAPKSRISPKIGMQWDINNNIKLRFAYFKENVRPIRWSQTLEPTQIAGFNQFFDYTGNNYFASYNAGIDLKLKPSILAGYEFSRHDFHTLTDSSLIFTRDTSRVYFNWTPTSHISLSAKYNYANKYSPEASELITHYAPVEIRFFDSSGVFFGVKGTYVNQSINSNYLNSIVNEPNSTDFFLADLLLGYRLPKRLGIASVEIRNIFDKNFRFGDPAESRETDIFFNNNLFTPDRTVFGKITLNF